MDLTSETRLRGMVSLRYKLRLKKQLSIENDKV